MWEFLFLTSLSSFSPLTLRFLDMKRLFVLLILLIIVWVGISYGIQYSPMSGLNKNLPVTSDAPTSENGVLPQEGQIALPQTLRIPKINVTANVEEVGLDAQGRMDVPKDADNVGWYKLGYKPGQKGNAVLAGHYDKETGDPAVFWDISKLEPGDKIIVADVQGKEYTFELKKMVKYPYNDFPIKEVFGDADKPMLNLITCQGTWDSTSNNYSHRIVVFAELVE
jgi:sortase A